MNRFSICTPVLLLSLMSAATSNAANLTHSTVLGAPFSTFSNSVGTTLFIPQGTVPTLTGTLAAGDLFTLHLSAPAGYLFKIHATPSGGIFEGLFLEWWSDDFFSEISGSSTIGWYALQFGSASKQIDAFSSADVLEYNPQDQFKIRAKFLTDDVTFKSVSVSFIMPPGFSRTFNQHTPGSIAIAAGYSSTSNLGPIASLVADPDAPVPEPASCALVGASIGALLLARSKRR